MDYFSEGQLFSGTVADASERDPLILKIQQGTMVRTVQHDSKVVNGRSKLMIQQFYNLLYTYSFDSFITR